MAGLTAEKNKFAALYAKRTNIIDEGVYDINVATGTQTNGGVNSNHLRGQDHDGLYSGLARVNYDYNEKYLLEVVVRRDGSSRFAPGFKFKNYGSISAGWNIYKERFLENFKALSNLKLRASIGTSGNQVGIGNYDYVSTITQGTTVFGDLPALNATSYVDGITTTSRTWENVEMKNIGVDFAFFNNRLSGTFEKYIKNNNGMLIAITYPEVLGDTPPKTNSGDLRTQGWEAMLSWKDKIGNLSYNIGLNMSDNTNKLVKLAGPASIQEGLINTAEGYPLNSYFAWQTDGLFQTQAEVDAYYAKYNGGDLLAQNGASGLRIGDVKKLDFDGNGQINDVSSAGGDVKFVGDAQLHYVFGINLGVQYKGFDFTTFFQGALQQVVFRGGYLDYPFARRFSNLPNSYIGQTWTAESTGAIYPRLTSNAGRSAWNWRNNDIIQQNNRYIRLKTIVVGYTLPSSFTNKLNINKVRVYFSGNDLFEFSSVKDGYDPESGSAPTETADISRAIYPFQRTIALGLNIAF
ncbi:TonB-dependent receptor [Arcticibacter svalbardensis MN12-7]|uniref:TonB-dependent receptor n=1 Tax=Arcticibacter svalbardensis MN12-7 TaxID=1150600 RepID=R9GSU6_9SPHI|nr:SusC/RagA family TonB-linked outer membrane protein [Arcticibacter svalbardensis]EOR94610.1 TonB-dependent receptor [Arcticibacter svalbardensis MN12-7]